MPEYSHLFAALIHKQTRLRAAAGLLAAAERLQTNNATFKQLAAELGFSDPFHFSRVFKSVIGLSPSRFAQGKQRE